MTGTKAMAQKIINAETWFIDLIMENYNKTEKEAFKVFEAYKKHKLIKIDIQMSNYKIKDGRFMDPKVIDNVLNLKPKGA